VAKDGLGTENLDAVRKGLANLQRHVENVRKFGVPAVVAINHFTSDMDRSTVSFARPAARSSARGDRVPPLGEGSKGTQELAQHVADLCDRPQPLNGLGFRPLTRFRPLWDKMKKIATEIYGASDIIADQSARPV
jgi:formate--tetrahydrofolate ligase